MPMPWMTAVPRIVLLIIISILGGAIMGASASHQYDAWEIPIAAVVGGVVGLLNAPMVVYCLLRKPLPKAVLLAFSAPWAIAVVTGFADDPMLAIALTTLGLWICCIVVSMLVANRPTSVSCCRNCGYEMTGNTSGRCPECFHRYAATRRSCEGGSGLSRSGRTDQG